MTGLSESEQDFTHWCIETARWYQWKVVHFRPARVGRGAKTRFVTPLSGDKGSPDLILAKRHIVLLRELKTDEGRLEPEQRSWLDAIGPEIGGIWRPRDRQLIIAELSQGGRWETQANSQ